MVVGKDFAACSLFWSRCLYKTFRSLIPQSIVKIGKDPLYVLLLLSRYKESFLRILMPEQKKGILSPELKGDFV